MTEPTENTPLVNPYPERYPDLHKGFVSLQQKLEKHWHFANWFLLHPARSEAVDNFMAFVTFSTVITGLFSTAVPEIRAEFGIQCAVPAIVLIAFWLIRWRIEVRIQHHVKTDIQTFVDSISESTLVDITVCLRDFATNDPVMSVKDKEYKKSKEDKGEKASTYDGGTGDMALLMVKHPSFLNTFRAIEYLLADYPNAKQIDIADEWGLDYFETIRKSNTYTGFLAALEDDRRIDQASKQREADDLAAKEKLASLKALTDHTVPHSA